MEKPDYSSGIFVLKTAILKSLSHSFNLSLQFDHHQKMDLTVEDVGEAETLLQNTIVLIVNRIGRYFLPKDNLLDSPDDGVTMVSNHSIVDGALYLPPIITGVRKLKPTSEPHILLRVTMGKGEKALNDTYYGLLPLKTPGTPSKMNPYVHISCTKSRTPKEATMKFVEITVQDTGLKSTSKQLLKEMKSINDQVLEVKLFAMQNDCDLEAGKLLSVTLADHNRFIKCSAGFN